MKKLAILLAMITLGIAQGHAQFYAGGSFGFTSSKVSLGDEKDQSGSSFKLLPEIGYQYKSNLAFGVSVGYIKGYAAFGSLDVTDIKALCNAVVSTAADVSSDGDQLKISCLRFAPYARYTVFKSGKFEVFVDGVIGFNSITFNNEFDLGNFKGNENFGAPRKESGSSDKDDDMDLTSFELSCKPGIAYNIGKSVKLFAKIGSVGYQHLSMKDSDFSVSRFGLDVDGNNMLLGAVVYF